MGKRMQRDEIRPTFYGVLPKVIELVELWRSNGETELEARFGIYTYVIMARVCALFLTRRLYTQVPRGCR